MPRPPKSPPEFPRDAVRNLGRKLIGPKKWGQKLAVVDIDTLDKVHKYLAHFAKKQYAEEYKNLYK